MQNEECMNREWTLIDTNGFLDMINGMNGIIATEGTEIKPAAN